MFGSPNPRIHCSVLDGNEWAGAFSRSIGADPMPRWTGYRRVGVDGT
jgi:hypothetical protein